MVNKLDLLTDTEFTDIVNDSSCVSDVLRKVGYSTNGNSWGNRIVKERMQILGLTFIKKNTNYNKVNTPLSLEDVLTEDSAYNRNKLKLRILKEGLKENKCEICGISEWQGKPISLQLHHINGIHNDNRLSNLQLLCPNCHSQTENFGSKGKGTVITRKAEALPQEDIDKILNTVRELGISEARKVLTYRNSLINSVVKANHDTIVMITPEGEEKTFGTSMAAAMYLFNELNIGKNIESNRTGISKCCSGKQKTACGGYKFYRRSVEA